MTTTVETVTMSASQTILAKQLLLPRDTATDAAARVAARVVEVLGASNAAIVDFHGLRGVASSYFNALFRLVGEAVGVDRMESGLTRRYESDAQKVIGERSWAAVLSLLGEAGPGHEVA